MLLKWKIAYGTVAIALYMMYANIYSAFMSIIRMAEK